MAEDHHSIHLTARGFIMEYTDLMATFTVFNVHRHFWLAERFFADD
jgi:hypothetical protein